MEGQASSDNKELGPTASNANLLDPQFVEQHLNMLSPQSASSAELPTLSIDDLSGFVNIDSSDIDFTEAQQLQDLKINVNDLMPSPAVSDYSQSASQSVTPYSASQPFLLVTEQPVERCRFRYKAEHGPHGALKSTAKKHKSCPKVKLENLADGCAGCVTAVLYTNERQPRKHVNVLWGQNCERGMVTVDCDRNGAAAFPNLGIMRQKEKDIADLIYEQLEYEHLNQNPTQLITEHIKNKLKEQATRDQTTYKDSLHSVRIGFQGHVTDPSSGQVQSTRIILSDPIYNSQNAGFAELKIAELDKSSGSVLGGDSIWLRCAAKVRRDQVRIRIVEESTGWEADGFFTPNEVYEQILIIFKTPAYHDQSILEPRLVRIYLQRVTDNEYSEPIEYLYLPLDNGPSRKRPRLALPNFGPDSFGFDPSFGGAHSSSTHAAHPSGSFQNNSYGSDYNPQQQQPQQHSEMNEYKPQRAAGVTNLYAPRPIEADAGQNLATQTVSLADIDQSLSEQGFLREDNKLGAVMKQLWQHQLQALWTFSGEGDTSALVHAVRQLVGYQDPDEANSSLHVAARNRQPFALKVLLDSLVSLPQKSEIINARNNRNQTALQIAVRYGDNECVHYLVSAGAERTHIDQDGNSVAHLLADTFSEDIYRDILFPPPNSVAAKQNLDLALRNNAGLSPLAHSVKRMKLQLIEQLLEAKAPLEVTERSSGKTALRLAVESADMEIVELLLKYKANVHARAMDGSNSLQVAVLNKHEPLILRLIAAGACPDEQSAHWELDFAQTENREQTAEEGVAEADQDYEITSSTLCAISARDIVELMKSERLNRLLNGEQLTPLLAPTKQYRPPHVAHHHRAREVRFASLPPMKADGDEAAAGPSGSALAHNDRHESPLADDASFSNQPLDPTTSDAAFKDDLGALDFVTRIRLSKVLDQNGRWQRLATALGCEHMIEFLTVCTDADETSSPTVLLLDQYEQMPGAKTSELVKSLEAIGETEAVKLIMFQSENDDEDDLEQEEARSSEGNNK